MKPRIETDKRGGITTLVYLHTYYETPPESVKIRRKSLVYKEVILQIANSSCSGHLGWKGGRHWAG